MSQGATAVPTQRRSRSTRQAVAKLGPYPQPCPWGRRYVAKGADDGVSGEEPRCV